ncbi:PREDICTED: gastric intrinsic factor [Gekko japonicus]|uniref:Gastric intrinsic factor n=1 Tax=Gekko japonicus TaxID=146911 RepID=A0ABM1KN98_GEKJA|nr:PREDICTED: gastric intrinsic factor [Gekko japonicus]
MAPSPLIRRPHGGGARERATLSAFPGGWVEPAHVSLGLLLAGGGFWLPQLSSSGMTPTGACRPTLQVAPNVGLIYGSISSTPGKGLKKYFLVVIQRPLIAIPDGQQSLITGLQTQLVNSVFLQTSPDPSVLVALNLADALDLCMKTQLVEKIKETLVEKNIEEMTSGKVALYLLALQSSCEDPENVTTPQNTVNLVNILEEKTKEEINYFYDYGTPKTTYYQLALDTLALCAEKSRDAVEASIILAKAADDLEFGGHFSVDTGAVASLALTCVREMSKIQQRELMTVIEEALAKMTKQMLGEQHSNGIIGNIYSTGLAMQALSVTSQFYNAGAWSCVKTKEKVLQEISLGAFNNPAAAAQILPSLVGKTYLDVRSPTCSSGSGSSITVQYTITNVIVGPNFSYSIIVNVPEGSVLLTVLNAARCAKPNEFSFQTEQTSWGPMVVSIHNIQASTNEKTYWQFLSGETPLDQGVGNYKPVNSEHIEAIFSRY